MDKCGIEQLDWLSAAQNMQGSMQVRVVPPPSLKLLPDELEVPSWNTARSQNEHPKESGWQTDFGCEGKRQFE
jgi:hypothetical protein